MNWLLLGLVGVLGLGSVGCRQGLGERCQVTSDCEDGLVCSESEKVCRETNGTPQVDAPPPPVADAMVPVADGAPGDAAPDGATDAGGL